MRLLENGRLVEDPWVAVAPGEAIPDAPAVIGHDRALAEAAALAGRNAPLGVTLPNDVPPAALLPILDRLSLVVVDLPTFKDGRAFTQARTLRERFDFRGEIRAAGHVLPDQYAALLRCGVTTVQVPDGTDPALWDAARRVVSIAYQPRLDPTSPLAGLRRRLELA